MRILLLDIELDVTEDGKVFCDGIRKNWWLRAGYPTIKVKGKSFSVHRIVATAFLPNPDNLSDVNHKDGVKENNHVSNLEWCSRRDNLLHAMENGLHAAPPTPIVGYNDETGSGIWLKSQSLAKDFGFSQPNINKCLKGIRTRHKNFKWEYA